MSRIFLLFLVFFCSFLNFSYADSDNIFLVENVAVNVSGKSPTNARNLAVATARRDAFLVLLSRLEVSAEISGKVTNEEISDMVRSEQIEGEKAAGNSYSGVFNILFAKDFVDHILSQKNLEGSKVAAQEDKTYLLIPVKMVGDRPVIWSDDNDWRATISKDLEQKNLRKKFIIPDVDLGNLAILGRDNVAIAGYNELEPMSLRYKTDAIYSLFFTHDAAENKATVDVYYLSKMQKKQFKLSFVKVDNLSWDSLLTKVADKVIDYLNSPQASENNIVASNSIRIQIPISSLRGWLAIKSKIENSNLVSKINIESISRDMAMISVNYVDSGVDIAESFLRIGLLLSKKADNLYLISTDN
jgi:hypothetical protein